MSLKDVFKRKQVDDDVQEQLSDHVSPSDLYTGNVTVALKASEPIEEVLPSFSVMYSNYSDYTTYQKSRYEPVKVKLIGRVTDVLEYNDGDMGIKTATLDSSELSMVSYFKKDSPYLFENICVGDNVEMEGYLTFRDYNNLKSRHLANCSNLKIVRAAYGGVIKDIVRS